MAAATPELEAYLHDVVRIGARIEARRGDHS
jgi:hypothetical protein